MHRHVTDPGMLVASDVLHRSGELYLPDLGEQSVEYDAYLHPCQRRAEAEVSAATEGQVRVRVPGGVEGVRVAEDRLVAVGRRPPQGHFVARHDLLTADLDVSRRGASVVRRR